MNTDSSVAYGSDYPIIEKKIAASADEMVKNDPSAVKSEAKQQLHSHLYLG